MKKLKLTCVSFKHEIDKIMYKVLELWPSFKHFNSTRQMASLVVVCTMLFGGGF